MLDFFNDLRRTVTGALSEVSMTGINARLRELFDAFVLDMRSDGILVWPLLRENIIEVLGFETLEPVIRIPSGSDQPTVIVDWLLHETVIAAAERTL